MAEQQDDAQKTEEPTPRRLEEGRAEGRVARSREVTTAALFAVVALACGTAGATGDGLVAALRPWLAAAHGHASDPGGMARLLVESTRAAGLALWIPLGGAVVVTVLAALAQHGPMWTPKALTPKPERISPLAGVKRLLSAQTVAELVRSLVKLALVGGLVLALGRAAGGPILGAVELSAAGLLALLVELGWRLFLALAVVTAALAALDFLWQWHSLRRQLRMSRREIVEEHKHTEGDPLIKQRLRGLRLARARRRMLAEVPKATVVITNPTHFAVALRYDPQSAPVPVLVAKGTDRVAARIRAAALAHGVPLVENPPLARLLHATVELGRAIPKTHYEAVAEVIGYVLRLRERAARRRPTA